MEALSILDRLQGTIMPDGTVHEREMQQRLRQPAVVGERAAFDMPHRRR